MGIELFQHVLKFQGMSDGRRFVGEYYCLACFVIQNSFMQRIKACPLLLTQQFNALNVIDHLSRNFVGYFKYGVLTRIMDFP